ncbi:MAG: sigma-70 family RNA polymerase sigma factor [Gemmatimonadales bacterium]
MPKSIPIPLLALLQARDEVAQNGAWSGFLDEYSDILLKTARRASFDHDGALDNYSYMLEQLRHDDFRRLRVYQGDSRGKFTTWLVVVSRRLCVDHHRHTHGRLQTAAESPARSLEQAARRHLADLIADEIDLDQVVDGKSPSPDALVLAEERRRALRDAVGSLDVAEKLLLTLRFKDEIAVEHIAPMVGLRNRFPGGPTPRGRRMGRRSPMTTEAVSSCSIPMVRLA